MDAPDFERLYAECFSQLQRFCYYKLPGKQDGDDALQEVAAAAWAGRESVRNADSFKPWLLQIARNKINDFYRRQAKSQDIPLDAAQELAETDSRLGTTVEDTVRDTLDVLRSVDQQILTLTYFNHMPQTEIARRLGIPVGTVKSRLHSARKRFRAAYPYRTLRGEGCMRKLPEILPEYTIIPIDAPPFECTWEETMGWFIIPKPDAKISWAMYDMPERKKTGECALEATGQAMIHGVEGVEFQVEQDDHDEKTARKLVGQMTDTHVRFLAESHVRGGVRHYHTFLDGDAFLDNWGFGEDNCGKEIHLKRQGLIQREGSHIVSPGSTVGRGPNPDFGPGGAAGHFDKPVMDIVDRCTLVFDGKEYDTVRVMDIESYNNGVVSEQFLDRNGRTILWRRFNRDNWHYDYYRQKWSEKLPKNERLTINEEIYVHWYDCITDYVI